MKIYILIISDVCLTKEKEFEQLIYSLTNKTIANTVNEWRKYSDLQITLPNSLQERFNSIFIEKDKEGYER